MLRYLYLPPIYLQSSKNFRKSILGTKSAAADFLKALGVKSVAVSDFLRSLLTSKCHGVLQNAEYLEGLKIPW